jgi:hypothetical protein
MKIYTSYYAMTNRLVAEGIQPIGVSRGVPKGFAYPGILRIAPTYAMISKTFPTERYMPMYKQILAKVDPRSILEQLDQLGGGADVAMLCWEKPGDFCHRHMIADWLEAELGIEIIEWRVGRVPQRAAPAGQPSLFDGIGDD